jgi:FMN reductase (NADPH)/FMN reductase [NAD(P)H]
VNPTLKVIESRCSTRAYDPAPLSADECAAVLHAAMRAPTAGNQMLYSIVEIGDQGLKDRLADLCDDQPFVARAPWVLLFLADWQKWMDLFEAGGVDGMPGVPKGVTPGLGDFLMACSDALIAAQTAVLAAESLGIGSCYIGDILENGETVAELLRLPRYTVPVAMLCFGRPKVQGRPQPHYEKHVVHRDAYERLDEDQLLEALDDLGRLHAPRGLREGVANVAQDVYARKFTAEFSVEMNRSAAWWLRRWAGANAFEEE